VSVESTSVGLDVHARSVVGCGLDGRSGELFERRLTPNYQDLLTWLRSLPGPVKVTYEVGLVPTESSSGRIRSQGGITKTGNMHVRRLLTEAAWHHRKPYRHPGVDQRRRWHLASPAARARGQQANRWLYARWQNFDARKKRPVVANTAVARELAGWCWSLAILEDD
jgi:hypothetical protein